MSHEPDAPSTPPQRPRIPSIVHLKHAIFFAIVFVGSSYACITILDRIWGSSVDLPGGPGVWLFWLAITALVSGPLALIDFVRWLSRLGR